VRSADGKIGVDNTFEGRLERMQDDLHRVVTERLFASTETLAALSGS
jgi:vacuolar-type H+-ATPase subunit E/Vma4